MNINEKGGYMENLVIYRKEVVSINKINKGFSEIACYTENGKYYLKFSLLNGWTRLYNEEKRSGFTKEFNTKESANNYFKKAGKGFEKIK